MNVPPLLQFIFLLTCPHRCCGHVTIQRAYRTTRLPSVAEPNSCTGGCGGETRRWAVCFVCGRDTFSVSLFVQELEASRVTRGMCFNVLFPQMKMIIALVVVALLLIIISEYLTKHTRTV